jgi:hypothetical protein
VARNARYLFRNPAGTASVVDSADARTGVKLRAQLAFIERSVDDFDAGHEDECGHLTWPHFGRRSS